MFYDGALQHGISVAVAQQKAVLCFVTSELRIPLFGRWGH
jgi:hypothetical protein